MRTYLASVFWMALSVSGAFAQNAIVTENQRTDGVVPMSQWDLSQPGSTSLQGFTTDISVNHGSTVTFKIQSGTNNWKNRYLPPRLLPGEWRPLGPHDPDERN